MEDNKLTEIQVFGDGPLRVNGPLKVTLRDGSEVEKENGATFCRCGMSSNKPFCDGRHKKEGWTDL
ncbi:CDGSH iron-sulfur domain-containing protein [Portibacter marinus]|uniref:CDGSH iron-sulfur domain-containing protein n=1 Tax=Portibacter marinus TaxID=2898660 RepID=UPI001F42E937|nr:CDGSH iron-sulfur domain-containing protein [Portibacter marinus]